ncbi:MAG: hypothetical protein AAB403_12805 [Planctomycetota bacterium]|mgnify:CR=1 FL=1
MSIDYALAKELKDAGLEKPAHPQATMLLHPDAIESDATGIVRTINHSRDAYEPSLSELMAACDVERTSAP